MILTILKIKNLTTFISIVAFLLTATNLNAQNVGIEHPELQVLYRGYKNKVLLSLPDCYDLNFKDIELTGTNCKFTPVNKPGGYIVEPGLGNKAKITLNKKVGDSLQEIHSYEYLVYYLPDPILFWGTSKSGAKASKSQRVLVARYSPELPLQAVFKIRSWTLSSPAGTVSGIGSDLSAANEIINATENSLVAINAIVVGPDGIARSVGGSWQVGKIEK